MQSVRNMGLNGIIYPFICKTCKVLVEDTKITSPNHRNGICRNNCDGIQRDLGGWPLEPLLRSLEIDENTLRSKEARQQLKDNDQDVLF